MAAEAVAHYSLTIKYLRKTAPWKFKGLFLLSIYVSSTSAPRMDHNDRIDWGQKHLLSVPGWGAEPAIGVKTPLGVP